jgi:hypothetical protein
VPIALPFQNKYSLVYVFIYLCAHIFKLVGGHRPFISPNQQLLPMNFPLKEAKATPPSLLPFQIRPIRNALN